MNRKEFLKSFGIIGLALASGIPLHARSREEVEARFERLKQEARQALEVHKLMSRWQARVFGVMNESGIQYLTNVEDRNFLIKVRDVRPMVTNQRGMGNKTDAFDQAGLYANEVVKKQKSVRTISNALDNYEEALKVFRTIDHGTVIFGKIYQAELLRIAKTLHPILEEEFKKASGKQASDLDMARVFTLNYIRDSAKLYNPFFEKVSISVQDKKTMRLITKNSPELVTLLPPTQVNVKGN